MRLFDKLKSLGGKLGLIRVLDAPPAAAAGDPVEKEKTRMMTRTVNLQQLASEVREEEVRILSETPAELAVSFDKIFEAAGVKSPAHGWTVERLKLLLATPEYRKIGKAQAQTAILPMLATMNAPVEDVVKDAVARDRALDAFEEFVRQKMETRMQARERRIAEIDQQIRSLEEEKAKLREEGKADDERWRQWKRGKTAYEKDMAAALGFLIDGDVVTTDP